MQQVLFLPPASSALLLFLPTFLSIVLFTRAYRPAVLLPPLLAFFAGTCVLSPTTKASPSSASPLPQAKSRIYQGFNYGSAASFSSNFSAARRLAGTDGAFASARLYTMIAPDTLNTPTPAIQDALDTNTTLLLGLWASAGGDTFGNELAALRSAIETYKQPFVDLVVGVSVGSEDLYRISERGKKDMKPGADTDTIVGYISRARAVLTEAGGGLAKGVGVGHADTWGVWRDAPDVEKVVEAVDWVGMNTFPYWQAGDENAPANGRSLFDEAYSATKKAAGKKEVWVTETGFPVTGNRSGQAVPGREAAESYWKDVGCGVLFGRVSTWWYTLQDEGSTGQEPSFGVLGRSGKEAFELRCEGVRREGGDEGADEASGGSSVEASRPAVTASAAKTPSSRPTANAAARW